LLLGQPAWLKVVLPTFYVSGTPDLARTTDPLFGRPSLESINRRGSSFWLETG
jgi:hypothetical protein